MLRFQYNEYLLFLSVIPLLIVLYFFVLAWKKKTIKKIGDARLVNEMIKNYLPQRFAIKFILIVLAFATGVLALANLRSPKGTEKVSRNGIDVMIALDVSKSMLAQDIQPNRLDRAKQVLGKLIDKLTNDRIGIVVFAGKAYLQMPLTGDHGAAKMYLASASTDVVPTQGTVVADALKMCNSSFNVKEKKYKSVVLISDGEDHDEGAEKIAEQMANEGISINTIGIGSPGGASIIDATTNQEKKDNQGNIIVTKLNEEELMAIAAKGNGIYQLFTNTDEVVSKLETQLNSMDQRAITEDSLVNYSTYFSYFLALTLILLVIEILISTKKKWAWEENIKTESKHLPIITGLFLLMIPSAIFAQNENSIVKKGNDAYEKKEYGKAIDNYRNVIEKNPLNATAQFNLGNALYRNKKSDEALGAYENAINNATATADKSVSFYNKGVVLQNDKKLPECIDAYKKSLKLNPDDEDARQNLQKALQQQKQQQQKEKKDKEKKKPEEDEKQKEKQKPKEDDKNNQPKPQPSKLSKQDAEEKLKALLEQEKNLQGKLRKVNAGSPNKPEKDW